MAAILSRIGGGLSRIENLALTLACIALVAMVGITVVDVGLRYIFHRPLTWSYGIINTYLMVAALLFGLAACQRQGDNIRINVVRSIMAPRLGCAVDIVTGALCTILCCALVYYSTGPFWSAWIHDERLSGENWPLWPSYGLAPACYAVLAVRFLLQTLSSICGYLTGQFPAEVSHDDTASLAGLE